MLDPLWTHSPTVRGVFIIGKAGDPENDNPSLSDLPRFETVFGGFEYHNIRVAAEDYEDVRLSLELDRSGTEGCDGNEWSVSWEFSVIPAN